MKITPEHIAAIRNAIVANTPTNLKTIESDYRAKGHSPMRFRWDCTYAAKLSTWICDNIYPYADDNHLDTALRNIMRELGLEWAAQK